MFGITKGTFRLILPTLQSPQELERLSLPELNNLAGEIREEICRLFDHRSVHFASNLGVVELCIALHTTFDFSWDRLIWDTGHQIYPHKLLTGRFNRFHTIRTKDGLMGFPNPDESEYDLMMTGHAGCSVGTAVGLACGDDLIAGPNKRHAVAVIGDGALGSGTVFEAFNHVGGIKKNITVVLNDNRMSICPRVGGLASSLDKFRMMPRYHRFKQNLRWFLDRVPFFGGPVGSFLSSVKSAIKAALIGGMLFEELGFRYIGPIDGHNIARMQRFLKLARQFEEPVLLHVITEKGRGFQPAVDNPTAYHAPPPGHWRRNESDSAALGLVAEPTSAFPYTSTSQTAMNGNRAAKSKKGAAKRTSPDECTPSEPATDASFTEHVRNIIFKLMCENDRVCVITAAMCQGNMLEPIREAFPERFFDVGICESHAVILAAGLAKSGMIPIVDIYSTFLQRAYDQLFQEVSLQNLHVVFAIDRAGLSGPDGPTHHGVFDLAYLRPFPNLSVFVPADALDVEPMFRLAVSLDKPVAIRYPKASATAFARIPAPTEFGKAEVVRHGRDGYLAVCGSGLLDFANETAKTLGKNLDGLGRVDLGVINVRFVKPLDAELYLSLLRNDQFLVTIEEGMLAGGFGSAVLEAINDAGMNSTRFQRVGIPDRFVPHGERRELLEEVGFSVSNLVNVCRKLMG